ncbi:MULTISPECIES: hypothetical protein [Streptomyces]|uniref:Uncharacterized protein n=1 Tax=Streptomyces chengmaiensis TaxID=3040919 RepID=A0ABT6HQI5_9ACTN|nr:MULTISPECIES: hypothetical protein [Streptomyces]MDH2390986.1 hypothetical protein [Streptomyces chengmaiensis]WRQ82404.1 hypothetical protein I3F59_025300 [Streptomyces sp. MUM 178J]
MTDTPAHTGPDHARDADACVESLRAALTAHGVLLPSLGLDLPTYASSYRVPPLVALGNCNLATARRLTEALEQSAVADGDR